MGQTHGRPSSLKLVSRVNQARESGLEPSSSNNGASEEPLKDFEFDPSTSYAIGYAIDKQTNPKITALSSGTVTGTKSVLNALVEAEAVFIENTNLYAASDCEESCTAEGIKRTFQEVAGRVGPNGIFFFHFSGHGIKFGGENKWGLATVDCSSADDCITADDISQWLNDSKCRAKHIVFTLDCCYAEGIGAKLTTDTDLHRDVDLYILCSCTANEKSKLLSCLRQSVFTFFLSKFILKYRKGQGVLPLSKVFSECQVCCESLSSLFISYENSGLVKSSTNPTLNIHKRRIAHDGEIEVEMEKYSYATGLFDESPPVYLHDRTKEHLKSLAEPDGSLDKLETHGVLEGKVVTTALCCMMHTIASIEMECDVKRLKVKNPNLSIKAFLEAASIIDKIHGNCDKIKEDAFIFSWCFYQLVMKANNIEFKDLEAKVKDLCEELRVKNSRKSTRSRVVADSDSPTLLSNENESLERPSVSTVDTDQLRNIVSHV